MAAGSFALPSWSRDELEVLSELQEGHLFIDETFAPNSHALGRDSDKALAIGWARMHEALPGAALFVGGAPPGDLVAGPNVAGNGIDDAWLAGALATVATRADLLLRLFASVDNEESGMLSLRFFKHGAWRTVLVDTMLPCVTSGPAFCHGASGLELWPSVLLKAYAKMHGGYAKLHGGDAGDALVDLTGGALSREVMPQLSAFDEDEEREAKLAQVWGLVRETEHGGGLLALEATRGGSNAGGSIAEDGGAGGGLMAGRLYPLLETYEDAEGTRLLRLRNPWGGAGWHGAWSEGSEELEQMQAQLARDDYGGAGSFWIALEDAPMAFGSMLAVRIFGEGWQAIGCEGAWHADSAGGAPQEPGWCDNPQFFVGLAEPPTSKAAKRYPPTARPEEAATLYAILSQSDRRVERLDDDGESLVVDGAEEEAYPPLMLSILQALTSTLTLTLTLIKLTLTLTLAADALDTAGPDPNPNPNSTNPNPHPNPNPSR